VVGNDVGKAVDKELLVPEESTKPSEAVSNQQAHNHKQICIQEKNKRMSSTTLSKYILDKAKKEEVNPFRHAYFPDVVNC
jgi:hypothetical protein